MGHAEGHARRRGGGDELLAFIEADRQRLSTSTFLPARIARSATGKCR
jgi:hypothetical protein